MATSSSLDGVVCDASRSQRFQNSLILFSFQNHLHIVHQIPKKLIVSIQSLNSSIISNRSTNPR